MSDQAITETTQHRCGHHGTVLTDIATINPHTGQPWGLRCRDCFPEAFPGYQSDNQRLANAQRLLGKLRAELSDRRAYAGDPDPGGTRKLAEVVSELEAALATHHIT